MKHLAAAAVLFAAQPAFAHPHVYIDAGLEVIFDAEGQLTHIQVTWAYDAFYSLLITEDFGMDADGDGALTPAEEAELTGFDAQWIAGFNGDLVATLDGQALKLSGPLEPTARMVAGQIVSSHLREVSGTPVMAGDVLSIKVFDETYYTAYALSLPVKLTNATGCDMLRVEPNVDVELSRMQTMLLDIDVDADLEEMDIPMMGEAFATELVVTCPAS